MLLVCRNVVVVVVAVVAVVVLVVVVVVVVVVLFVLWLFICLFVCLYAVVARSDAFVRSLLRVRLLCVRKCAPLRSLRFTSVALRLSVF